MDQEELEPCFTGTFEHTLDAKGRVSLPSKVRRSLPQTVKTVLGLQNDSVLVFDPKAYKAWVDGFFPNGFNRPLPKTPISTRPAESASAPACAPSSGLRRTSPSLGATTTSRSRTGQSRC